MTGICKYSKRFGVRLAIAAALLASLPAVTGCRKSEPEPSRDLTGIRGEQFAPPSVPRHVLRIADVSAASGARADATLHSLHFDAGNPGGLSSLGEQKLNLMLSDDDALPIAIYLNVSQDELYLVREQSVKVYLRDRGLSEQQMKIVAGPNTGNYNATAPKLRDARLADTEAAAAGQGGTTGGMTVK